MIRTILIVCLLIPIWLYAQTIRNRNIAWVTPTGKNHVIINGLALGLMAMPAAAEGQLQINGLNIEVLPLAVFTLPGSMINTVLMSYAEAPEKVSTIIHGISISGGMFQGVEMHGFALNIINSYASYSYGTEVSFFMNSNYAFSGSQLSMWGNRAAKGKGFQLGLFNSCNDCRVLQIGLLNRIGNHIFPLINFNFKKDKQKAQIDTNPPGVSYQFMANKNLYSQYFHAKRSLHPIISSNNLR